MCELYDFVLFNTGALSTSLIPIFTIFRLIIVYLPHRVNIYCSRKRALLAIALAVGYKIPQSVHKLFRTPVVTFEEGEYVIILCFVKI